jgi:AcrR family transcriptional regulator
MAGLRARKRESTQRSIWQMAIRLFAERGYDNVTIEEIADQCQVSPRTVFRYFGTKEDVLFAGTEERRVTLMQAIEAQPPEAGAFQVLARACRMVAEDYEPDLDLMRARARIVEASPGLQPRNAGLPQQWDRDVLLALRESGRAAGIADLELRLLVGASMTALRICIDEWIVTDADLLMLIDTAFDRLGRGLALRAHRVGRLRWVRRLRWVPGGGGELRCPVPAAGIRDQLEVEAERRQAVDGVGAVAGLELVGGLLAAEHPQVEAAEAGQGGVDVVDVEREVPAADVEHPRPQPVLPRVLRALDDLEVEVLRPQ